MIIQTVCIPFKTPSMAGDICVGQNVLKSELSDLTEGKKCFVVTDSNVRFLYKDIFEEYFADADIFVLPAGEESKNFQALFQILHKMTKVGLHRTSRLFAVGGGVVGDIGGLAAALYMRGISCVQIPTTLLAQIDSSVGGKTAVDLGGVKNVVGAFYQPCKVLVDPDFLDTLSPREIKCGVGEVIKYAALNANIFDVLSGNIDKFDDLEFLKTLIAQCIQHKVDVVQADEKETGERRSLNVGHTTGHAIELSSGLSHGESVLWGMALETRMAIDLGVCEETYGKELLKIIHAALDMQPRGEIDFSNLEEDAQKARSDKKNTEDGRITMALPKDKGGWITYSLSFEEYCEKLRSAVENITADEE